MRHFTNEEKKAIHRIFNHVDNLCSNYHGQKSPEEALKFASLNRWVMYPHKTVLSLRDGAQAPFPNIYIGFYEYEGEDITILDNGHGQVEGYIGVSYGNTDSFTKFQELKRKKPADFMKLVNGMNAGWRAAINQKIKTDFPDNTPVYREIKSFESSKVTIKDIDRAISKSNNDLLQRGEIYNDEEVLWCVTIFGLSRETSYVKFDNDIKEAFALFQKLLNLKPLRNDMAQRLSKKLKRKPKKKKTLTGIHRLKALESRL